MWKFLGFVFSLIFIIFSVSLLFVYWFVPFEDVEFVSNPEFKKFENNYNFTASGEKMQFYENMRYQNPRISYKISDICTLQKKAEAETAFEILEEDTMLDFYPVIVNEEISVTCDDRIRIEKDFFVAGEGGPMNITKTENFNVILKGGILLLRESKCQNPNVALHEILHALGFDHSSNPNNIMYNISKCSQVLGEDIPNKINEIYSVPSYADLSFEDASAIMKGRYLDLNASIRNNGLKKSEKTKLIVYADDKAIKEIDIDSMDIGYGISLYFSNILVPKFSVNEIKIVISSNFEELNKNNNEVILEIKK